MADEGGGAASKTAASTGHANAGRNAGSNNNNNKNKPRGNREPKFEGRNDSLMGHVYNLTGNRRPDQFIKTTKEVAIYVAQKYTEYTRDFVEAVQNQDITMPTSPPHVDPADPFAMEQWKMDLREFTKKEKAYKDI